MVTRSCGGLGPRARSGLWPERAAIDSAISTLKRRGTADPSADQVVAATSFGLWVRLTGAGVPRDRLLSYETTLWQPRLQHAFPRRGDRRCKYIHAKLDDVRILRNRIAHDEPIYRSPLQNIYDDILEIAAMIRPEARDFVAGHSRTQHPASVPADAGCCNWGCAPERADQLPITQEAVCPRFRCCCGSGSRR